uniref:Uncharacterized protein n=1 Tax=Setaria italica TaxID=4555 RepID=K3YFD5_SETIT
MQAGSSSNLEVLGNVQSPNFLREALQTCCK